MKKLHVLHLEDNYNDAFFVRQVLADEGYDAEITHAVTRSDFVVALEKDKLDVILFDQGVPGFSGKDALRLARARCPESPCILVSGSTDPNLVTECMEAGAVDHVHKSKLWQLSGSIEKAQQHSLQEENQRLQTYVARLEAELTERNAELQSARSELESLCSTVSNNLDSPLRSIHGYTVLMQRQGGVLDEQGKLSLGRVRSEALRIDQRVEGLLRLADYAKAPLHCENLDLAEMASLLRAGRPEVELRILEPLPAWGDKTLLAEALGQLVSNAWKYTSKRSDPLIELGRARVEGAEAFYVRDNGVGFDQKYEPTLYVPFQRLHREHQAPGQGLGLAIVQRIIHRHGGRVWAKAAVNKGATFYFTLTPSA